MKKKFLNVKNKISSPTLNAYLKLNSIFFDEV